MFKAFIVSEGLYCDFLGLFVKQLKVHIYCTSIDVYSKQIEKLRGSGWVGEGKAQRGYSGFQVTGMIEGFWGV